MLFNSFTFVFIFLPISLIGYYSLSRKKIFAASWLVFVSLYFYAWWNPLFLVLLLWSIAFNYLCGLLLQRKGESQKYSTFVLILSIVVNLSLLGFFKYLFPVLAWLNFHHIFTSLAVDQIILPLGISFFTFTQIGYLIDCKAGIAKDHNPIEYMLFVTFFPHLIAGPILHHQEMMPQFSEQKTYQFNPENLAVGIVLFIFGLFKKVVIADSLAPYVHELFPQSSYLTFAQAWMTAFAYVLQLYFDFSGYSDMAIGLARMFGIVFPANFNSPLRVTSIIDFWQRWHMTFTRYLNLYIYNPIALYVTRRRVEQGKPVDRTAMKTIDGFLSMLAFPILFTMAVAGVWHGAGSRFLYFGLMHGFFLVVNHAWRIFFAKKDKEKRPVRYKKIIDLCKGVLTFVCIMVAFIMFRANSVNNAIHFYKAMIGIRKGQEIIPDLTQSTLGAAYLFMVVGFIVATFIPNTLQILSSYRPALGKLHLEVSSFWAWKPNFIWILLLALMTIVSLLHMGGVTEFLYFQF